LGLPVLLVHKVRSGLLVLLVPSELLGRKVRSGLLVLLALLDLQVRLD
jgi:hypothetical protein